MFCMRAHAFSVSNDVHQQIAETVFTVRIENSMPLSDIHLCVRDSIRFSKEKEKKQHLRSKKRRDSHKNRKTKNLNGIELNARFMRANIVTSKDS